jgi:energy-coupling factor transport system substrate-specific component
MHLSIQGKRLTTLYLVIYGVLGGIMFLSKVMMIGLPNIHLIGLFIAAFTLTFRAQALIPIYVYIFLSGIFYGFSIWWVPHLYIWLPLWGAFMIFGNLNLPSKAKIPVAMSLCALHGFTFGLMYAPFQALVLGFNLQMTIAWIVAGIPFDIIHGVSNLASGVLVIPLAALLKKLNQMTLF